ncbi:engulfment and cell motility protein 2-like isoform X2 [Ruditapes philippinarum]|uniref:engulfment and cell motility protein 2-like isoform X2 n=1 Tax=Ruditapes philippinarum TaxID=129788 RepID=UPI00295B71CA|nr:engulfment and cell motility protein 2-like isoform X2 [Ruditapes philippinarum]
MAQTPGSRASSGSTGSRGHAENIKKVAVTMPRQQALFMELDQNRPLAAIVQDICDKWTLQNVEDYALQFSEPSRQIYITEHSRTEIQNGNVLQLTDSPSRAAQTIIDKLAEGNREDKIEALKNLSMKCSDATFSHEFIKKKGLKLIIDYVIAGNKSFNGDPLMFLLRSFVALMEHNVVSWDILEPEFIKQVATCISGARAAGDGCIQPSLEILESVILHSTDIAKMESMEQFITPDKIVPYMQSSNADVQQSALALLNAMFIKSSPEKKQKLAVFFQSKTFRSGLSAGILEKFNSIGPEMGHQLYIYQRLMLNMYEGRMNTGVNVNDAAQVASVNKSIEDLRKVAFDFSDIAEVTSGQARKSAISKDLKKLGFANQTEPVQDFEAAPPGLLALDNMTYFAQVHKESYIKVVLENCGRANEQDCPFVQASIKLTKILCDLLKIGESLYDDEHFYYPMFFYVDKPVEEFFSYCIQTLNRTWKEMRASKEDFSKVLSVVNEQITRALDKNQMPKSFDQFKSKVANLAYPELKKIWEAERQKKDESKAQAKPILELREIIKPEITELIRKHRLTYLEGGSRFPKFDNRGNRIKNRYQFWRLSPNHKAFHYGDCNEKEELSLEQLQNKVSVMEIKELVVGKNCLPVKNTKRMQPELAFSIVLESSRADDEVAHHFLANNDQEYMIWTDGINALLNCKMTSQKTRQDMDVLLNMEVKLRLLETEGITIPKEPPPIPPMPANFNFAYTTA